MSTAPRWPFRRDSISVATASLVAIVGFSAIAWLHSHILQSFSSQLTPLRVTLAAPGVNTIKLYWERPATHPDAYVTVPVVKSDVQIPWDVRLEALPDQNPAARHNELSVFAIRTPEETPVWNEMLFAGQWSMRVDHSAKGMEGRVAWTTGKAPNRLSVTLTGSRLTVVLGRGPYCGKVRITVNRVSQVVDLFQHGWRVTPMSFFPTAPGNYGAHTYDILVPRGTGRWNRLQFVAEPAMPLTIQRASLDDIPLSALGGSLYEVPAVAWPAHRSARIVTLVLCTLLVATIVLGVLPARTQDGILTSSGLRYECLALASLAGMLALALTALFYPGLLSEDAAARWRSGMALIRNGQPLSSMDDWFPPLLTLLMIASHKLSGEFGLPTFLQSFFFYYCLGLLSVDLVRHRGLVLTLILGLLPPIVIQAALLSSDAGTAIGLMACASLIWRRHTRSDLSRERGRLILFVASGTLLFGMRHNNVAMLPLVIAAIWILFQNRSVGTAYALGAIVSAVVALSLPRAMGIDRSPASSVPLVWEHIGILKALNDPESRKPYQLDSVGNTAAAISLHEHAGPGNLVYGRDAPFPRESVLTHATEVRTAFWRLVRDQPGAFFVNRAHMYVHLLGIPQPLYRLAYFEAEAIDETVAIEDGEFLYYVRAPGSVAVRVQELNARFVDLAVLRWVFRPWFLFTLTILTLSVAFFCRLPVRAIALVTALATGYYASFFILGSGTAFRFYFPSCVLLLLAFVACMAEFARAALNRRTGVHAAQQVFDSSSLTTS